jgi:hypothetical protein
MERLWPALQGIDALARIRGILEQDRETRRVRSLREPQRLSKCVDPAGKVTYQDHPCDARPGHDGKP